MKPLDALKCALYRDIIRAVIEGIVDAQTHGFEIIDAHLLEPVKQSQPRRDNVGCAVLASGFHLPANDRFELLAQLDFAHAMASMDLG